MNPARTVNIAIQVLPLADDALPVIERAIDTLRASGLTVEVGPLETTIEGPFEEAFAAAKAAHLACIEVGVGQVVTLIKIADGAEGSMTIAHKTGPYRRA